jgi:protein-tyrosine phosphatase
MDFFEPLVLGFLTWVIFTVYQLNNKLPIVISCDCFNDLSHDEMLKLKEMYISSKESQKKDDIKEEESDGEKVEKED